MSINKKDATIKDIARIAGVSASTVSNALSGERIVKKETRKKILRIVNEQNYIPNIFAQGLTRKKTNMMAVLVPDIGNIFYTEVIKGVEEVLAEKNYLLLVNSTHYNTEHEKKQINRLVRGFTNGIILIGGSGKIGHLKEFALSGIPIVSVNRFMDTDRFSSVLINHQEGIEKVFRYLFSLGHRKIGYVGWKQPDDNISNTKWKGYLNALDRNKLKISENHLFMKNGFMVNEYRETYNILKKSLPRIAKDTPTALICQTDLIAFGVLDALKDGGYSIPQDISVVGYGNILSTKFSHPKLTTVNLPKKRMGRVAASLLLKDVSNINRKEKIYLKTSIITRDSAMRPLST